MFVRRMLQLATVIELKLINLSYQKAAEIRKTESEKKILDIESGKRGHYPAEYILISLNVKNRENWHELDGKSF